MSERSNFELIEREHNMERIFMMMMMIMNCCCYIFSHHVELFMIAPMQATWTDEKYCVIFAKITNKQIKQNVSHRMHSRCSRCLSCSCYVCTIEVEMPQNGECKPYHYRVYALIHSSAATNYGFFFLRLAMNWTSANISIANCVHQQHWMKYLCFWSAVMCNFEMTALTCIYAV